MRRSIHPAFAALLSFPLALIRSQVQSSFAKGTHRARARARSAGRKSARARSDLKALRRRRRLCNYYRAEIRQAVALLLTRPMFCRSFVVSELWSFISFNEAAQARRACIAAGTTTSHSLPCINFSRGIFLHFHLNQREKKNTSFSLARLQPNPDNFDWNPGLVHSEQKFARFPFFSGMRYTFCRDCGIIFPAMILQRCTDSRGKESEREREKK